MSTRAKEREFRQELQEARNLHYFDGFERLWNVLVRLGLEEPGSNEGERAAALRARLSERRVREILANPAVDRLLNLDPPLETVLIHPQERLRTSEARCAIEQVQRFRGAEPLQALNALCRLLLFIRNKRAHGFKTPDGSRDQEILKPAAEILGVVADACLDAHFQADQGNLGTSGMTPSEG